MTGPIAMFPEAEDNYGTDSCSILCLHPLISRYSMLFVQGDPGGSISVLDLRCFIVLLGQ